jgi:hypothetical protein
VRRIELSLTLPLHDLHFISFGVAEADDFAAADGGGGLE